MLRRLSLSSIAIVAALGAGCANHNSGASSLRDAGGVDNPLPQPVDHTTSNLKATDGTTLQIQADVTETPQNGDFQERDAANITVAIANSAIPSNAAVRVV